MKKKIVIGTLLLSSTNPAFADDIAPLPVISGPVGLHTQIGNSVIKARSSLS